MKRLIQTTDNNGKGEPFDAALHLKNLQRLSANPLCKLDLDEHPNLLIFPSDFKTHGDDIGEQRIFTIENNRLLTGNIMGFIGYRDTQVSIRSRFAQNDSHDYFLHYMLQRVFAINLFDLKFGTDNEGVFDFLIYLFPAFLKRAMRQGIYKEYQTRNYNDANVRGRIDVARYIRQNLPFTGKIAYTTREYVTDNYVTQLIRHTIDSIAEHPMSGSILYNDEETREVVSRICQATPTYNRSELRNVINRNLCPVCHPYFDEYRNLQRLCLQILRHEEIKYGNDDNNQIYGILFDGAWLWEEYLNLFLGEIGFKHPRNKTGEGRKYLFDGNYGVYYPDFYNKQLVLDAKYKFYDDWNKIQQRDILQIIAYMHVLDKKSGGFIVPVSWTDKRSPSQTLNGIGGTISVWGLNVKKESASYSDFIRYMKEEEERIKKEIS